MPHLVHSLIVRWLAAPPLPRRLSLAAWSTMWWDGIYRGAVAASLTWVALIAFALIVAAIIKWKWKE